MDELTQLGSKSEIPANPDLAVLETFKNPRHEKAALYLVRLSTSEFTSLCPITGQPDFARIVVDYIPKDLMIESKSFKLFMMSFRNHGAFHEACSNKIALRLYHTLKPYWLSVSAYWNKRGGVGIDTFVELGYRQAHIVIPPHAKD